MKSDLFSHLEVIYGGQYNAFWLESANLFVAGVWLMSLLDKRCLLVNNNLLKFDRDKVSAGEECLKLVCSCMMSCGLRVRLFPLVALRQWPCWT